MNPLAILWLWRIGGVLALASALWGGVAMWERHIRADERAKVTAVYEAAITKQKVVAAKLLAVKTAEAAAATLALQEFKDKQELQDVSNQKTVSDLSARITVLAGVNRRLRDPNQTGCGGSGAGAQSQATSNAASGAADPPQTDGLFSAGATELLERLTREADEINVAYASCRADAIQLRQVLH